MGYTSLLLKTGRTTSSVTGDDGDLELGAARSYTVLDTGQYALTTDIILNGKTDTHTNNCVQDNTTGLMWSKARSSGVGYDDGKGTTGALPWTTNGAGEGIFPYKDAANAASLAGYTDWRIPNMFELISVYEAETGTMSSDFNIPSYYFWASTPLSATNASIFASFTAGTILIAKMTATSVFCILVRGTPTAPPVALTNPGYTSLLLKTGQTTKYVDGDDGDLELGVAKSFTLLDTGQYSGTTNITMDGRTEAKSNNCVQDNITGLMWSSTQSASVGPDPFGKGATGQMPWTTDVNGNGIFPYKDAANTASFAGHSDWRIPNILEYMSLFNAHTGYVDPVFTTQYTSNWVSTTNSAAPTKSIVIIAFPETINSQNKTEINFCGLVRGTPTAPPVGVNTLRSLLGAGY